MIFALTAPNFEYWSNFRCKDQGMNFMPEHLAYLDPSSKDPHKHKFEVTPGVLANYFGKVFEDDVWSWKIYRAWPYMIQDQARSLSWRVFYKIFAIAYKDEVFASFVKGVSDA